MNANNHRSTHLRHDHIPSHAHQIVYANPCPSFAVVSLARGQAAPRSGCSARNTQFCTNFAAPVQEKPDVVTFPCLDCPARCIGAIVEHERNGNLGILHSFLYGQKLLSQLFSSDCFGLQGGFCHDFRGWKKGVRVWRQLSLYGLLRRWYRWRLSYPLIRRSRSWCRSAIAIIFIVAKRKQLLGRLLFLLWW